jgi:hypothetical protein
MNQAQQDRQTAVLEVLQRAKVAQEQALQSQGAAFLEAFQRTDALFAEAAALAAADTVSRAMRHLAAYNTISISTAAIRKSKHLPLHVFHGPQITPHTAIQLPMMMPAAAARHDVDALHTAVCNGNWMAVWLLLSGGVAVDAEDDEGCTALMKAASRGHIRVVWLLLGAGAAVNAVANNFHKLTALHNAATSGHDAVVQTLLAAGAEVNGVTADDSTALHLAAQHGHAAVVGVLLANGADVDAVNGDDDATALHMAAAGGHVAVVEKLLAAGADVGAVVYGRFTAFTEGSDLTLHVSRHLPPFVQQGPALCGQSQSTSCSSMLYVCRYK